MTYPTLRPAGFDGFLVSFGDALSDRTNRAALAFRAALEAADLPGMRETSTSLASAYLRFDPGQTGHDDMRAALTGLLDARDWYDAPLPEGRSLWRIPVVFGGEHGPQLEEAAELADMDAAAAVASITEARLRVQTIGFAPGMPYLGDLGAPWDIPRQSQLTAEVPRGGLCVAVRQLVLFPNATPTGWRHIGQTRVRLFRPDAATPFLLKPGDEITFEQVDAAALDALGDDPDGGAVREDLP